MSRLASRMHVLPRAFARSLRARRRPADPARILIAHHLLLGDTLQFHCPLERGAQLFTSQHGRDFNRLRL